MDIPALTRGVLESAPGSDKFVDCTRALAEAALARDRGLAREATRAIFSDIVEPWSDSFEPDLVDSYVYFMSEVVYAPRSPIAAALRRLGYADPIQLRERYQRIRGGLTSIFLHTERVKRVVVLSRVTLGADVAVTSVFIRGASHCFLNSSVDFIAPRKNAYLLGNGRMIKRTLVTYSRSALLADRLKSWVRVRALVQKSIAGLEPGEWVVIDPDSRLTQLGLLPVADDRHYQFFESRSIAPDVSAPLGELASDAWWLGWVPEQFCLPYVLLRSGDQRRGQCLRMSARKLLAAVSFGVGGRASKRLGGEFEDALLELLRRLGYRIVLDYGAGDDEARIVDRRVAAFCGSKSRVRVVRDAQTCKADLMTCRGSLSSFAGWMNSADVFLGYDSASAHVAAARFVPVVQVFAGAPSERFRQRWTPFGAGDVCVVPATGPEVGQEVLARVERELVAIKQKARREGLID